jgi:hypothetical protein
MKRSRVPRCEPSLQIVVLNYTMTSSSQSSHQRTIEMKRFGIRNGLFTMERPNDIHNMEASS